MTEREAETYVQEGWHAYELEPRWRARQSYLNSLQYDKEARPTWRQGVHYRSRLEARFAEFYAQLGRELRYEPQIVGQLDGRTAKLDFFNVTDNHWIELQWGDARDGFAMDASHAERAAQVCMVTRKPVIVIVSRGPYIGNMRPFSFTPPLLAEDSPDYGLTIQAALAGREWPALGALARTNHGRQMDWTNVRQQVLDATGKQAVALPVQNPHSWSMRERDLEWCADCREMLWGTFLPEENEGIPERRYLPARCPRCGRLGDPGHQDLINAVRAMLTWVSTYNQRNEYGLRPVQRLLEETDDDIFTPR